MNKTIKNISIIIGYVMVVLIILHVSVVSICWGFDIFKIRDLAGFIGWDKIEYVTSDDNGFKLILSYSSYNEIENANEMSETERIFAHLEGINSYINSNDRYKNMKITIQYGERMKEDVVGLSHTLSFANHSLGKRGQERYDGFYSVMCEMGNGIGFEFFQEEPWNNIREIIYTSYFLPTDTQAIQNLTKLDYVCFFEQLDGKIYNELCNYAPWCKIEVR